MTHRKLRRELIARYGYNLFELKPRDIRVDLLTDSGTTPLSEAQRKAVSKVLRKRRTNERAYAGNESAERLRASLQEVFPDFPYVILVHQGRGAERVFCDGFIRSDLWTLPRNLWRQETPHQTRRRPIVIGNAPFDTTRGNIEAAEAEIIDATTRLWHDPSTPLPFKGNVDVELLGHSLIREGDRMACAVITATCNTAAGQPVSTSNFGEVGLRTSAAGTLLVADIARIFLNGFLNKKSLPDDVGITLQGIIKQSLTPVDLCLMSAKKDALSPGGGCILMKDRALYEALLPYAILSEGGKDYGGMTAETMEAFAVGLKEGLNESFLEEYTGQVSYLGEGLKSAGWPVYEPFGGHAVYLDAGAALDHLAPDDLPGQACAVELYIECGVRACELGTAMAGRDPKTGKNRHPRFEFVRLALPRVRYTRDNLDLVIEGAERLWKRRRDIHGMMFVEPEPPGLRHFTATYKWK